jgi:hypothetical protein
MMTLKNNFNSITFTGLFWGIIGGFALIYATKLTTNGPLQITPYPFLLIAAILTIAFTQKSTASLNKLFKTGLITFTVMSLFLYVFVISFINPNSGISILGHLWRIALIFAVGTISSYLVAVIVKKSLKHNNY